MGLGSRLALTALLLGSPEAVAKGKVSDPEMVEIDGVRVQTVGEIQDLPSKIRAGAEYVRSIGLGCANDSALNNFAGDPNYVKKIYAENLSGNPDCDVGSVELFNKWGPVSSYNDGMVYIPRGEKGSKGYCIKLLDYSGVFAIDGKVYVVSSPEVQGEGDVLCPVQPQSDVSEPVVGEVQELSVPAPRKPDPLGVGASILVGAGPESFDPYRCLYRGLLDTRVFVGNDNFRVGGEVGFVSGLGGSGLNIVGGVFSVDLDVLNTNIFWLNFAGGGSVEPTDGGKTALDGVPYYGVGFTALYPRFLGGDGQIGIDLRHNLFALGAGRFDPRNDATLSIMLGWSFDRPLPRSHNKARPLDGVVDDLGNEESVGPAVLEAVNTTGPMPEIEETTKNVIGGDPVDEVSKLARKQNYQGAWGAYLYGREHGADFTPKALNDAASAARSLGDILSAYLIWGTFPVNFDSLDADDPYKMWWVENPAFADSVKQAISEYEQSYGYVSIVSGSDADHLSIAEMPFQPDRRASIKRAKAILEDGDDFSGLLPAGDYSLISSNKKGEMLGWYTLTVASIDDGQATEAVASGRVPDSAKVATDTLPLQTFSIPRKR